jgi:predicted transcriptional regulator
MPMKRKTDGLTEQELEIMKVVWDLEKATVREVYERLLERRRIAYTTVMTMMNILEKKGHLGRDQVDRAYVYKPTRPQRQVVGGMLRDFIERVFDGSAKPLLAHLVEENRLSEQELKELVKLARQKTGGRE